MQKTDNGKLSSGARGVRGFLRRFPLYERLKGSWVYDWYWTIADKGIIASRRDEISFYRNILRGFQKGDLIFDVGANHGYKTDIFLKSWATVIALDPDEHNREILIQKFLRYRLKKKPLVIVGKAVSSTNSVERFWIDAPGSALNTLSTKWVDSLRENENRFGQQLNFGKWKDVETVSIEQLISDFGAPFFIKIDVEGHELSVLLGMKNPVPYLSFEVNLPEFKPEGLQCVQMLSNLAPEGVFNYTPDCRSGLALLHWLRADAFTVALESCNESSIEIFWKSSVQ